MTLRGLWIKTLSGAVTFHIEDVLGSSAYTVICIQNNHKYNNVFEICAPLGLFAG